MGISTAEGKQRSVSRRYGTDAETGNTAPGTPTTGKDGHTMTTTQDTTGYAKITAEGAFEVIDAREVANTYRFLQEQVGGHFDVVSTAEGLDFWLHDEGMFVYPVNHVGTAVIVQELGHSWQNYHGPIIVARHNGEGETVPLNAQDIDALRTKHGKVADLYF